jgi:hypothetical protein
MCFLSYSRSSLEDWKVARINSYNSQIKINLLLWQGSIWLNFKQKEDIIDVLEKRQAETKQI